MWRWHKFMVPVAVFGIWAVLLVGGAYLLADPLEAFFGGLVDRIDYAIGYQQIEQGGD